MRKQQEVPPIPPERSPLNKALDVLLPEAPSLFAGKVCGKCGGPAKPLEAFGKNAAEKDGKQRYCKECMNRR